MILVLVYIEKNILINFLNTLICGKYTTHSPNCQANNPTEQRVSHS